MLMLIALLAACAPVEDTGAPCVEEVAPQVDPLFGIVSVDIVHGSALRVWAVTSTPAEEVTLQIYDGDSGEGSREEHALKSVEAGDPCATQYGPSGENMSWGLCAADSAWAENREGTFEITAVNPDGYAVELVVEVGAEWGSF